MRLSRIVCLALSAFSASTRASAAPPHPLVQLELSRAPSALQCLDARALQRSVEARLDRRVFEKEGAAELHLRVELARVDGSFRARILLSDEVGTLGERELSTAARHCSALDDSLALVVALLVDTPPERAPQALPSAPPVAPASTPPQAPPQRMPSPLRIPRDTLAPREPWAFDASVAVGAWLGLLPGAAPGVEAAFGVKAPRGPWLRVSASWSFPRGAAGSGTNGADFSAVRAGVDACGTLIEGTRAEWSLCLGERIGALFAKGYGFDRNVHTSTLFNALAATTEASLPWSQHFAVIAALGVELPLTRSRFYGHAADGLENLVFETGAVIPLGRLGLRGSW